MRTENFRNKVRTLTARSLAPLGHFEWLYYNFPVKISRRVKRRYSQRPFSRSEHATHPLWRSTQWRRTRELCIIIYISGTLLTSVKPSYEGNMTIKANHIHCFRDCCSVVIVVVIVVVLLRCCFKFSLYLYSEFDDLSKEDALKNNELVSWLVWWSLDWY